MINNNNFNNGFGNFGMGVSNGINYNNSPLMNNYNQPNDNSNNINTMGGNNNMNQNNNNQQQREPLSISIEPIEFDGLLKTKFTTTVELSKMVNEIFRPVFSDYEGCLILPNQAGGFDTVVYFCDKGVKDERLKALRPVVQQGNQLNISQRINNINRRFQNKTYELTEDAKDVFGEFIIKERNVNKIRWNQIVTEKAENNYNSCVIHVQLRGLDIMKIIKKIYGASVKGNRTDYSMKLERGIGIANTAGFCANYLVSILQLDTKEVERVAQSVGMVPLSDTIPMVR